MYRNKKILAIVPARGGSKGIKLKNLKRINKKSLIRIVGELLSKIKYIDFSIISTDNKKIADEAKKYNLEYFFKRPKKLSGAPALAREGASQRRPAPTIFKIASTCSVFIRRSQIKPSVKGASIAAIGATV